MSRRRGPRLLIEPEETRKRLLDAVKGGVPLNQAVHYAGIGYRTLFRYLERGEAADAAAEAGGRLNAEEQVLRDFWRDVREARAQVAVRNVALVQKAAQGGYLKRERVRRWRDPESGQVVTETDREYADVEWRAAQWLLQTSFSREFGRDPDRVELEVVGEQAVGAGDAVASLAARVALVAARRREEEAAAEDGVVEGEWVEP